MSSRVNRVRLDITDADGGDLVITTTHANIDAARARLIGSLEKLNDSLPPNKLFQIDGNDQSGQLIGANGFAFNYTITPEGQEITR